MEVTLNIPDELIEELNKHIVYHNVKNRFIGKDYEASIDDVIIGSLNMYLHWTKADTSPLITTDDLRIESKYIDLIKRQNRTQKEISDLSGIPKSTLSVLLNGGSVPTLETFIRIWMSLGKPPIQHLLSIEAK